MYSLLYIHTHRERYAIERQEETTVILGEGCPLGQPQQATQPRQATQPQKQPSRNKQPAAGWRMRTMNADWLAAATHCTDLSHCSWSCKPCSTRSSGVAAKGKHVHHSTCSVSAPRFGALQWDTQKAMPGQVALARGATGHGADEGSNAPLAPLSNLYPLSFHHCEWG